MAKDLLDTGTKGLREAVSISQSGKSTGSVPHLGGPQVRVRGAAGSCGCFNPPGSPQLSCSGSCHLLPGPDDSISQLPPSASLTLEVISNKTLTSIHRCVSLSLL